LTEIETKVRNSAGEVVPTPACTYSPRFQPTRRPAD